VVELGFAEAETSCLAVAGGMCTREGYVGERIEDVYAG